MEAIDLKTIPVSPGVYLYKDGNQRVVYVGKAINLRKRVASYFRKDEVLTPKTRAMLRAARTVDTLTTTSEKEALLLEASLIKKHRPRYNIVLRDDKQYVLFKLTKKHAWPRLTITRKVQKDGASYFGPFTSAQAAKETWKAIHRVFRLRRCSDRAFQNRVRPCLYHHMGQCYGPCCMDVDREAYLEQVQRVEMLLAGRSSELVTMLSREMEAASESLEFERAAVLRDQIRAVQVTVEQQAAVIPNRWDMDVIGLAETDAGLALSVLFVRRGILLDKQHFFWSSLTLEDGPEILPSFLAQYYGPHSFIPSRIIIPWAIPGEAEQHVSTEISASEPQGAADEEALNEGSDSMASEVPLAALVEALEELRGGQVLVVPPRNDTENRLVSMASANALEDAKSRKCVSVPEILAAKLGLPEPPYRIEAVDVSHTSGQDTRVGMVVYEDGVPAKDQYRTYAFADEDAGGDDYGVLAQWMSRRLESGPPWPDLLLIDGGKGQLGAVERVLAESGNLSLFGIASIAKARSEDTGRADRRKSNVEDRIFLPNRSNPVNMKAGSPELLFLQRMRDAVHDFAIGRHRKARAGAALTGELQRIPGVGPALAKALWQVFPNVKAMAAASVEDLASVPGVGRKKAQAIYDGLSSVRER